MKHQIFVGKLYKRTPGVQNHPCQREARVLFWNPRQKESVCEMTQISLEVAVSTNSAESYRPSEVENIVSPQENGERQFGQSSKAH
jgi:hypothetical protein